MFSNFLIVLYTFFLPKNGTLRLRWNYKSSISYRVSRWRKSIPRKEKRIENGREGEDELSYIGFSFFLFAGTDELGSSISTTLPSAPTELSQFPKLCELRRKFPVLYRVEFQVRTINPSVYALAATPLPHPLSTHRFDVFEAYFSFR